MTDVLTPEQRRRNMSAIRSKNTKPEMLVRSLVHRLGYRYRLHRNDLLGKPDLVFPRRKKVILVHGCFWHMHRCRYGRVTPKTNAEFWQVKRLRNVVRDRQNLRALRKLGWEALVVWECWTKDALSLERLLTDFLDEIKADGLNLQEKTMQKEFFSLDAIGSKAFEGFSADEYWNGFACPYFTFEQAQEIVAAWKENGWEARYDAATDAFIFSVNQDLQSGHSEEFDTFQCVEINGLRLYPVGAFSWTWDVEVEAPSNA